MRSQKKGPRAKVISLLNQKGGVGKTTLAYNLAFAFHHENQDRKVLALDLDPQGNLSLLFDLKWPDDVEMNIFHLLINSVRELKVLHQPVLVNDILRNKDGVDYLPSGPDLSGFELSVAAINSPRQLILRRFLEKSGLLDHYDVILIDGPPTLGLLVVNMVCASDGILIPFQADQFSRHGLNQVYQVIDDVAEMEICPVPEIWGLIPNLVESRRKLEEKNLSEMDSEFQRQKAVKIFAPLANRLPLAKSNNQKKSVFAYSSREYVELQEQFLEMVNFMKEKMG